MNLQVVNFQRRERAFACPITREFMCLMYVVTCVLPLQVGALLYTLLYSTTYRIVVQYLYFKPWMFGNKRKSSGI